MFRLGQSTGVAVAEPMNTAPIETSVYYLMAQNSSGCSGTATVTVQVNALPIAAIASLSACADGVGQSAFDLLSLRSVITGGDPNSEVSFFSGMNQQEPVVNSSSYRLASGTVYAEVLNNQQTGCFASVPVALLAVNCPCPTGNCLPIQVMRIN